MFYIDKSEWGEKGRKIQKAGLKTSFHLPPIRQVVTQSDAIFSKNRKPICSQFTTPPCDLGGNGL